MLRRAFSVSSLLPSASTSSSPFSARLGAAAAAGAAVAMPLSSSRFSSSSSPAVDVSSSSSSSSSAAAASQAIADQIRKQAEALPVTHSKSSIGRSKNTAGAVDTPSVTPPIMSFLADPNILPDTVDGTIEACEQLMYLLKSAKTPTEKHDILDSVSNVMCLLMDPCEMVRQMHPNDTYKLKATEAFTRMHQWMCEANTRRDLYDVVVELTAPESRLEMGEERIKNVTQMRRDMESNGIHLSDKERARIVELNMENEELAMMFVAERDSRNPYGVLRRLIDTRHNLASLLGFESFAEQRLRGSIVDTPEKVWHFLCTVANKYRPYADKEVERVRVHLGEVKNRNMLTDEDRAKVCRSLTNRYSEDNIEQYFSVANCLRGIQIMCESVFGIVLKEVPFEKDEFMHKDMQKFHCHDKCNSDAFLGVIVVDMFARRTKLCQAGHITVQLGCMPHQGPLGKVGLKLPERQYPIVVLTCNAGSEHFAARRADGSYDPEATLMMPHEITTAFHEFGHSIHTILGQTTVQNLAGTRGSIDYVECFSQLFEQWTTQYDFLKLWAKRRGFGNEPIPEKLVQRRNEVHNMFRHLEMLDQVMLSAVDQTLHGPQPFVTYFPQGNTGKMGKRTLQHFVDSKKGIFPLGDMMLEVAEPLSAIQLTGKGMLKTLSFEHLATYPGGYYGYLYSAAFARRIWHKNFAENPMSLEQGLRLRDEVMCYGAACNAGETLAKYLKEDINDVESWI